MDLPSEAMTPAVAPSPYRWPALEDAVAEEVPVALVYNGVAHAVMMATPQDLEDFALGFSLTEGLLRTPHELLDAELLPAAEGLTMSLTVTHERAAALRTRRRNMAGRTGCGLCGIESLKAAMRPVPRVEAGPAIGAGAIARALAELPREQAIHRRVHAVHAAAWAMPDGRLALVREDVGRHNALDKLCGAMARRGTDPRDGFALITSRCSYEMVQKAAVRGIGVLVAISAPTSLALEVAEFAGITLVTRARGQRFTLCTHADRIAA